MNGQYLAVTLDRIATDNGHMVIECATDEGPAMEVDQKWFPVIFINGADGRGFADGGFRVILWPTCLELVGKGHLTVVID